MFLLEKRRNIPAFIFFVIWITQKAKPTVNKKVTYKGSANIMKKVSIT